VTGQAADSGCATERIGLRAQLFLICGPASGAEAVTFGSQNPARNSGLMRSYRNCTFRIFGTIVNPSVFLVLLDHDNSLHNFLASFNNHNGIVRESSDCFFQLLDRHFAWFLLCIVSGFVNQKSATQSRHDLDGIFGPPRLWRNVTDRFKRHLRIYQLSPMRTVDLLLDLERDYSYLPRADLLGPHCNSYSAFSSVRPLFSTDRQFIPVMGKFFRVLAARIDCEIGLRANCRRALFG